MAQSAWAVRCVREAKWRTDLVQRGQALVKRRDATDPYRAMLEKVIQVAEARRSQLRS